VKRIPKANDINQSLTSHDQSSLPTDIWIAITTYIFVITIPFLLDANAFIALTLNYTHYRLLESSTLGSRGMVAVSLDIHSNSNLFSPHATVPILIAPISFFFF
jgi:hypothetical protein